MVNSAKNLTAEQVSQYTSALRSYQEAMWTNLGKMDLTNQQAVSQDVKIDANFPNVESADEIEKALQNLVNMASQKASSSK